MYTCLQLIGFRCLMSMLSWFTKGIIGQKIVYMPEQIKVCYLTLNFASFPVSSLQTNQVLEYLADKTVKLCLVGNIMCVAS